MIAMNLKRYSDSPTKLQKTHVVVSLVMAMRDASPYGGFLKRDPTTNRWISIGDTEAREKVGHCLRDMIANSKEIITDDNSSRGNDSDNNLVGRDGGEAGGELILFEMDGGNGGIGGKSTSSKISKKGRSPLKGNRYGITSSRGPGSASFGDGYDSDEGGYGDDGSRRNKKRKRLEMSLQQERILQALGSGFNGTVQQLLRVTAGDGTNNNDNTPQENDSSSSSDDDVEDMKEDPNVEDDGDTSDDEEAAADEKVVEKVNDGDATSEEKGRETKEVVDKSKDDKVESNNDDDKVEQKQGVNEKSKVDEMEVDGEDDEAKENGDDYKEELKKESKENPKVDKMKVDGDNEKVKEVSKESNADEKKDARVAETMGSKDEKTDEAEVAKKKVKEISKESKVDKKEDTRVIETSDSKYKKVDEAEAAESEQTADKNGEKKDVKKDKAKDSKEEVKEETKLEGAKESNDDKKEEAKVDEKAIEKHKVDEKLEEKTIVDQNEEELFYDAVEGSDVPANVSKNGEGDDKATKEKNARKEDGKTKKVEAEAATNTIREEGVNDGDVAAATADADDDQKGNKE